VEYTFVKHAAAKPEQVFDAIADVDGFQHWMKGIVGVEKLTEGEFGVGTRFAETRKFFGMKATEIFEVTAFEPGRSMSLQCDGSEGSMGKGMFYSNFSVEPDGEGTKLTHAFRAELPPPRGCMALFARSMEKQMKKALDKDMDAMVAYAEGVSESRQL